ISPAPIWISPRDRKTLLRSPIPPHRFVRSGEPPAHVSGSVPVWRKARLKAISCACKRRFDMPDQIGPCEPERFGQGQDGRNGGQTLTSLQHGDECSVEIGLEGLCFLRHSRTLKPPLPDSVERSYRPNSPSPTRSWLN